MKKWWHIFKERIIAWSATTCSCLVIIIILGILIGGFLLFAKPRVYKIYEHHCVVGNLNDVALTAEEASSLDQLIAKNKIVPLSMIYDKTLNYYDSLISVLGLLIAALGILLGLGTLLSYVSMRSKIKDTIDDEIKSNLADIFFQSHLKGLIEEKLAEETPDLLKNRENVIAEITERVKYELEKDKGGKLTLLLPTGNER